MSSPVTPDLLPGAGPAAKGSWLPTDGAGRGMWAILAFFCVISLATFESIYEDGYIYFRVAAHLARGHGYVFNVGGEHIETGSSVTWQFLMAFLSLLPVNIALLAKITGIGFAVATLRLVFLLSRKLVRNPALQVVPSLFVAVAFPFYAGAQRGLETPLYVFAVVLLAYVLLDDRLKSSWHWAALLLVFSRSEGFAALAGLAGFFAVERADLRGNARRLSVVLGGLALSYVCRYFYFHDLVPHPFYLKILFPNFLALAATKAYFIETWTWLPLTIGAVGLLLRRSWDPKTLILGVFALPFVWWASWAGGGMAQFNQHITPALPVLFVLMARGLDRLIESLAALKWPIYAGAAAFSAWASFGAPALGMGIQPVPNLFVTGLKRAYEKPNVVFPNMLGIVRGRRPRVLHEDPFMTDAVGVNWQALVGEFIRRTYPKGITVVYDQMGQTPWYAGLDKVFIDSTGLTYRATGFAEFNARLPAAQGGLFPLYRDLSGKLLAPWHEASRTFTREQAIDQIFALNPHLIIENVFNMPKTQPDGSVIVNRDSIAGLIAADPRLNERYVKKMKPWLCFFERRDIADRVQWDPRDHDAAGKADSIPVMGQGTGP